MCHVNTMRHFIYFLVGPDQALHTLNRKFGEYFFFPPLTWESICDTTKTHM